MSSLKRFIRRKVCTQEAVYWEFDGLDGFSSPSFKDPVVLNVRWDEKSEVVADSQGKEYLSNAQILTPDDLVKQSYLMLGNLGDVAPGANPVDIESAREIQKMDRHPEFGSKTFDIFIAYL